MKLIVTMGRVAAAGLVAAAVGCAGREAVPEARREPVRDTGPYAGAPEVVGDSMLRFPGGKTYAPRIYGLEYVATMRDPAGEPVLLLSGAECYECDAPKMLYLRAPERPLPPPGADTTGVFGYPGRVFDYMDEEKVDIHTTVFHGECLDGRGPVVLQFATVFDSTGARTSAYATELAPGGLRDFEAVPRPDSAAVLARVAAGRCREIPGEDQVTPP